MRIVNALLCLLFVLFVAVQYDDPDGPIWMLIYAIPAAWAGFAAYRPNRLLGRLPTLGLGLCLLVSIVGMLVAWPTAEGFWRIELWWSEAPADQEIAELAREGMGMMIVTVALLVVAFTRWRLGRSRPMQA